MGFDKSDYLFLGALLLLFGLLIAAFLYIKSEQRRIHEEDFMPLCEQHMSYFECEYLWNIANRFN